MSGSPSQVQWGPFQIDAARRTLSRDHRVEPVQPRVFEVLWVLATHLDQAVSRQALLEAAWPGVRVVDNALTQVVRKARIALGDDVEEPQWLLSVPRYGYRLRGLPPASRSPGSQREGFVGRGSLVAALSRREPGLRCVVGPGGIGKSRLLAEALRDRRPAVYVDLAGARDRAGLCTFVGQALGVADAQIGAALSRVRGPVVLEALEHVAQVAGDLLHGWLGEAPTAELIVTSRLPIPGAEPIWLGPLDEAEVVELLSLRAGRSLGGEEGLDALVDALGGHPLAVELVGVRLASMRAADLARRLHGRLLSLGDERNGPRLATLRACLDSGFELLGGAERRALVAASVFEGRFDAAAADRVGGEGTAWDLAPACALGLVTFDAGPGVWRLSDPVREWARELPGADDEGVLLRHAQWAARPVEPTDDAALRLRDLVAVAKRPLASAEARRGASAALYALTGRIGSWHLMLEALRELGRAAASDTERAENLLYQVAFEMRLGSRVLCTRLLDEVWRLLEPDGDGSLRARARIYRSQVFLLGHEVDGALRDLTEARSLSRVPSIVHAVAIDLSRCLADRGMLEAALEPAREALRLGRDLDAGSEAHALVGLARIELRMGDTRSARGRIESAVVLFRSMKLKNALINPLSLLANIAFQRGDFDDAVVFYGDALAIAEETGDATNANVLRMSVANALVGLGELDAAEVAFREARRRSIGVHAASTAVASAHLSTVARLRGDAAEARRLALEAVSEAGGWSVPAAFAHAAAGRAALALGDLSAVSPHVAALATLGATHRWSRITAGLLEAELAARSAAPADALVRLEALRADLAAHDELRGLQGIWLEEVWARAKAEEDFTKTRPV